MKNWWHLIVKALVFVLLFCLVDFCIGPLFVHAKDKALERHPSDMWLKSSYSVEKVDAECIIIGSSTAVHHYIPEEIERKTGLSTYNCGQDGCFFLYGCCMINSILERYSPKTIIMDLNPGRLLDSDKGDEYQNMRFLSYYYDDDAAVKNFIDGKDEQNELLYHTNFYRYNSHAIYTFYPVFWGTSTEQGYVPLPYKGHNPRKKIQIGWDGNWVDSKLSELYNTIDNCKKNGVELIIVTSPCYAEYEDSVMEKSEEFAEILGSKGVKYINLLDAAPFDTDPSLYKTVTHLNAKGAAMMTDTIINVLRPAN